MPSSHYIDDSDLNSEGGHGGQDEDISRRPRDLVAPRVIAKLAQRTDYHALVYFSVHMTLIVIGGAACWYSYNSTYYWPLLVVQATIIGFLFSPLHELAHFTACKTKWLNETLLWVVALIYVIPPYYFRYFHLGHHRYTQIPGKDTALVLPEPANIPQYLWYCLGLWFWWRNLGWAFKHAFGIVHSASSTYVPSSKRHLLHRESRIVISVYVLLIVVSIYFDFLEVLLIGWIVPRFLGEPVQRLIRVAEHVGCEESSDLTRNTRTTITNCWVNFIAWRMPYHAEHHLYPNVPFHALAELHHFTKDKVIVEPQGYCVGQWKIVRWLMQNHSGGAGVGVKHRSML